MTTPQIQVPSTCRLHITTAECKCLEYIDAYEYGATCRHENTHEAKKRCYNAAPPAVQAVNLYYVRPEDFRVWLCRVCTEK
jgi:hypothetical protein